jgi:hypothetical protein
MLMAFYSGGTTMDQLIDLIANELIATGAWVTADGTLVAGAAPAKRALQHATDPNFFVYFARNIVNNQGGSGYVNEILVQLSTGFNAATHVPSGTVQSTGIPCEASSVANNKAGTHYTWVDASGVTLLATWAASGYSDYTVFFTLERNTAKEYSDGFSNFFCASITNANYGIGSYPYSGTYYGNAASYPGNYTCNRAYILRPFNYAEFSDYNNAIATFFGAYRSLGNSKVYFEFPFFSNNQNQLQRMPIAQTGRFFLVQPGQGLSDGDLITYVQGPNTYTYLVKLLQSPDSAAYTPWAIRQA